MEQIHTEDSIENDGQVESEATHGQGHEEINVSLWRYLWDEINRGQVWDFLPLKKTS